MHASIIHHRGPPIRIAAIIPARDEAAHIGLTLDRVREGGQPDVLLVVDCASTDATRQRAREARARVIGSAHLTCRAEALNVGLEHLRVHHPEVDVCWFIHADSAPPMGSRTKIERALVDPEVIGGAFGHRFTTRHADRLSRVLLYFVVLMNRLRYRISGIYLGDQGLFARLEGLERIGGVPRRTLLEDAELCRRLRRLGRLRLVPARMTTSPRRFLHHGIIRQMICDWAILLGDRWNLRSETVHGWYNRQKGGDAPSGREGPASRSPPLR